ncbi:MAG: ribosomal protein L7/L12 [Saccharofermentans sp.]|nr:ribosomal protein L7/L12 [Saccharofermentans sp.]
MGLFDFFKRKTDDQRELDELNKKTATILATPMSLEDTVPEVMNLLSQDRKLEAIKYIRDKTGISLKEAKDFVEKYADSEVIVSPQLANALVENYVPDNITEQAKVLLSQGRKMEAIKLVKDNSNLGLKDCKDYVEKL